MDKTEIEAQLTQAKKTIESFQERLTLSEQEREVLKGHEDGTIRVADLRPMLRRVFGIGNY